MGSIGASEAVFVGVDGVLVVVAAAEKSALVMDKESRLGQILFEA